MQNNLQFGMDMSHPTTRSKVASFLLSLAIFIFVFLGASYILTTCEWAIHLPLFRYNIIIAFIIAIASITYLSKELFITKKQIVFIVVLFVIITLIGIFLNSILYNSYVDGDWYHSMKIACFKNGWNPDYEDLNQFLSHKMVAGGIKNLSIGGLNAIQSIPSAIEILYANLYSFTNNFQGSKVVNILILIASFSLVFSFLAQLKTLKLKYVLLFSVLLLGHVFGLKMLFSFMVDSDIYYYSLIIIIICLWYVIEPQKYNYFLLVTILPILINIKFSGLIFSGLFFICLVCYTIVLFIHFITSFRFSNQNKSIEYRTKLFNMNVWVDNRNYKKIKTVFCFFIVTIIVVALSIVFFGFHPYFNNLITEGNIFYPAMGKKVPFDLLGTYKNLPIAKNHNYIMRFVYSLFAQTDFFDNAWVNPNWNASFKIPFTFKMEELILSGRDTIIGEFGPFYGGILIVGFFLYVYHIFKNRKDKVQQILFFLFLFILITILIVPVSYHYRYVPQAWLLPIIIMFSLIYPSSFNFKIISKVYIIFASVLLFITMFFASLPVYFVDYYDTKDIIKKLDYITQAYNKLEKQKWECDTTVSQNYGMLNMLQDKGVILPSDENWSRLNPNDYMIFRRFSTPIVNKQMKNGEYIWGVTKLSLNENFIAPANFFVPKKLFDSSLYNLSLDSSWLYKHLPYHDMLYR